MEPSQFAVTVEADRMIRLHTVALYGSSLIVSNIGASLQSCPDLQVLVIDPAMPGLVERLRTLQADIFLFDLETAQLNFSIALWTLHPDLLLIGVNLKTGMALVFSGQPARALTTVDLLQMILSHTAEPSLEQNTPIQAQESNEQPGDTPLQTETAALREGILKRKKSSFKPVLSGIV